MLSYKWLEALRMHLVVTDLDGSLTRKIILTFSHP